MTEPPPTLTLTQRRQHLLSRSARLREQLCADVQALEPLGQAANRVQSGVIWLRHHPLWVAAAVAVLVARRPRRTVWAAWRLWGWWRVAQRWVEGLHLSLRP